MKLDTSKRKRFRVSNKVKNVASNDRYRLSISRSSKNISAQIIDDMGLKGFKIGGAEISTMHSNFIINTSSASSKDIYELITVIQQKVLQKKGIYLQPEVRMIGFDYPN